MSEQLAMFKTLPVGHPGSRCCRHCSNFRYTEKHGPFREDGVCIKADQTVHTTECPTLAEGETPRSKRWQHMHSGCWCFDFQRRMETVPADLEADFIGEDGTPEKVADCLRKYCFPEEEK